MAVESAAVVETVQTSGLYHSLETEILKVVAQPARLCGYSRTFLSACSVNSVNTISSVGMTGSMLIPSSCKSCKAACTAGRDREVSTVTVSPTIRTLWAQEAR